MGMYCRDCGKKVTEWCHSYRCRECCIKWRELIEGAYRDDHEKSEMPK